MGKPKADFEFIKSQFKAQKCELLQDKYINNSTRMKFRCSCGTINFISWRVFRVARACRECGIKKAHIKIRKLQCISYKKIKSLFSSKGCVLLTKKSQIKPVSSYQKLEFLCVCGNIGHLSYHAFIKGSKCKKCKTEKTRITHEASGRWIPKSQYSDFYIYERVVSSLTRKNYLKYKVLINPKDLKRKNTKGKDHYQLDHVYSVLGGFTNNINPHLIAHPCNLRMLFIKDNASKRQRCDITIEQLVERIKKFNP